MARKKKSGATRKAPQNQAATQLTEEQMVIATRIQEKGQAILDILSECTYSEAGSIIKTCETMLHSQVQALLQKTTPQENGYGKKEV